ncbi:SlyX family protein [Providencia stuartii]|uniref:SlyX family protein n=1 Tax=Providencia stuartii TaxID=588 RepID=UPI0011B0484B|nr:SlyX family protein [Providencia stuartii]
MSNQHLESVISELSARVTSQDIQIAELQKQLTDMQAKVSCGYNELSHEVFQLKMTN